MIKKTLYPKTKRIQYKNRVVITEKLDGSNIGFFKVNGDLIIAQRNNIFLINELEENKQMLYRGLKGWLDEYGENLKVNRNVEGFVIAQNNNVNKYVRMKNGQLQAHHE